MAKKGLFRIEATIPENVDPADFIRSLRHMASETATDVRSDFELTTETFDKPVKFRKRGWVTGNKVRVSVTTDDENYKRLNDGVKGGYKIPKDGPGLMVFQTGYKAKTRPHLLRQGFIRPQAGGPFGDLIFVNTQITAKGFEARNFDKAIAELWEDRFARRAQLALSVPFGKHISPSLKKRIRIWRKDAKYSPARI